MNQKTEKKRAFHMPHVFIILLLIMLFIVILSYVIPSGSYERIVDSATGITVIDPDTFQYVKNENPIRFMDYFEAVYNGFVNGATIMGTLFICSGMIYLLEVSGAFGASINLILKKNSGQRVFRCMYFLYCFCYIRRIGLRRSRLPLLSPCGHNRFRPGL